VLRVNEGLLAGTLHSVTAGGSDGEVLTACSIHLPVRERSGFMACVCVRECACVCVRMCNGARFTLRSLCCAPIHTAAALALPSLIRGPHSISAIPALEGRSVLISVRECSQRPGQVKSKEGLDPLSFKPPALCGRDSAALLSSSPVLSYRPGIAQSSPTSDMLPSPLHDELCFN
jgi:hypothetical protein